MSKTVEELLKPRIKCVIRYPDSPFPVGAILEQDFEESNIYNYLDSLNRYWMLEDPQLYPEVFKKLEWWEGRTLKEMPAYVKVIREDCAKDTGLYCKVYKWHTYDDKFPLVEGQLGAELEGYKPPYILNSRFNFEGQIYGRLNATHLLPATAEEYEAFKSKTIPNG